MAKKQKEQNTDEPKFAPAQLAASRLFSGRADVLNAVLDRAESYTIAEAERLVSEYLTRKV